MNITDLQIAQIYLNKEKCVRETPEIKHKFSLTLGKFIDLAKNTSHCEYSGLVIAPNNNLSFERKNPFIGYTDENTILVDLNSNKAKGRLDQFVKNERILVDVKLRLLEEAKDYIIEVANKKAGALSPAAALLSSIHNQNTKHVVRENSPLQLEKPYKHGSVFLLSKDKEEVGTFVLIIQKQMVSIAHGRGQRKVEVELASLLNLATFESAPSHIEHSFATLVEVLEKA